MTDPFYGEEVVRFELRGDDVLAVPPSTGVDEGPAGTFLRSTASGASVPLTFVSPVDARAILAAIDGTRSVTALRATFPGPTVDAFLGASFGKVVFAPFAVVELERRLSASEIVRYPGSPYEVVRPYWENMIDVAAAIESGTSAVSSPSAFVGFVRGLHATALLGRTGDNQYRPSSPIVAKRGVEPGALHDEPTLLDDRGPEIRFVSGLRVSARAIGGQRYQELLAESVRDPGSLLGERTFTSEDGLSWGRIVTGRAAGDAEAAPWFCPPRPLTATHWEVIRTSLRNALEGGARDEVTRHLADFHQAFLRAHPFAAGNQSVVMSLLNHVLRRRHGVGMPHLILDHLALRLSRAAYEEVFVRAARHWHLPDGDRAARLGELIEKKRAVFAFLRDLSVLPLSRDAPEKLLSPAAGLAFLTR